MFYFECATIIIIQKCITCAHILETYDREDCGRAAFTGSHYSTIFSLMLRANKLWF